MSDKIQTGICTYYESANGLVLYVKDQAGEKSYKAIMDDESDVVLPFQELPINKLEFQNGKASD